MTQNKCRESREGKLGKMYLRAYLHYEHPVPPQKLLGIHSLIKIKRRNQIKNLIFEEEKWKIIVLGFKQKYIESEHKKTYFQNIKKIVRKPFPVNIRNVCQKRLPHEHPKKFRKPYPDNIKNVCQNS